MVGDDDVDRAVLDTRDDGLVIGLGTQRRVHLEVRIVRSGKVVLVQNDMMRGSLSGNQGAAFLTLANDVHAACRGDVLDVDGATGELGQGDVALDLKLFARSRPTSHTQSRGYNALVNLARPHQILVLTVAHNNLVERLRVIHDTTHHAGTLNPTAVIGESNGAMGCHVTDFRKRLALKPLGAGTGRVHMAVAGIGGLIQNIVDGCTIIGGRRGVGHGANARETAVGSCSRACFDSFLVLLTGVAQMHVDVHQARNRDAPGAVEDLGAFARKAFTHLGDGFAIDEDVGHLVQAKSRVDYPYILNEMLHLSPLAEDR